MSHVIQVFWFILVIEFDYGVVYAVPDRFQQVKIKVRSQPGQKAQIFKLKKFNKKRFLL